LSIFDFVWRFRDLSDFFKKKLRECLNEKNLGKEAKERSDMVIFSILLFISRLIPAFQYTDSNNITQTNKENESTEEEKSLQSSREQSMNEYIDLIRTYSKNGTYFVRKISAQALLPIMRFDQYITEIKTCF